MTESPKHDVALMVLAKGFRVSQDSEEFQLVWPPSAKSLTYDTERRLLTNEKWPAVLRALYSMPKAESWLLPCVLLSPSSASAVGVAPSRDKYKRPMMVAVCATASITWASGDVGDIVSHIVALSRFTSGKLARRFDGNPKDVGVDLRSERFEIDISDFDGPSSDDIALWRSVIHSAREWRGVSGLGAPPLVALGANVMVGTEHEAMRFASTGGTAIDGFYDAMTARIVPTSQNLVRWNQAWQPTEPTDARPPAPPSVLAPLDTEQRESVASTSPQVVPDRLESIDHTLRSIDRSVSTFADVAVAFLEAGMDFWFGTGGRRGKR